MRQRLYNLLAMGILIGLTNYGLQAGHIQWSATAIADSQRLVSVYADGQKKVFATNASSVGDVITRAGFKMGPNDLAEPATNTKLPAYGPYNINVYRARPVLVVDGLKTHYIESAYQSPRLLAQAAGLKLYPEDTFKTNIITDIVGASTVLVSPTCFGTLTGSIAITVTGGTAPYSYSWSNGFNGANPTSLSAGTYNVIVTDANGCKVNGGPYNLINPSAQTITVGLTTQSSCNAATGTVKLTSSDNSQITVGTTTLASGSTFTGLRAGYYTATSNGTCPVSTNFSITNNNSDQCFIN